MAAAALILLAAFTLWVIKNGFSVSDYEAGIGETKTVTLADQSVMTLNTRTPVRVQLTHAVRRVDLLSGEALFGVAKDSTRPFEVHALGGVSTAVGTEFDLRIAGASAVAYAADQSRSGIRTADINAIRGWQAHWIVFTDKALSDALDEYNRYTKLPIVLGDPGLAARRINGVFRIDDQTAFIKALEQGLRVAATPTDKSIVLKPR
jgi:transmembrane sensor